MSGMKRAQSSVRLLSILLIAACQTPMGNTHLAMDTPVADFHLMDVNLSSTTADQQVSPRDYLEQVSGWYFGHST